MQVAPIALASEIRESTADHGQSAQPEPLSCTHAIGTLYRAEYAAEAGTPRPCESPCQGSYVQGPDRKKVLRFGHGRT